MKIKNQDDILSAFLGDTELPPEATYALADPVLLKWYQNYKDRIIWIDKEIDESLYEEIKMIINWNKEDEENNIPVEERKPITCLIQSYGGDIDAMFSFIDVISASKCVVKTVNMGASHSAAAIMLLCGTPGYRYTLPHSVALIHQGSGAAQGTYEELQAQNQQHKKYVEMMNECILERTKITKAQLGKWKNKDIYISAQEQLEKGIVDKIITDITEIF